LTNIPTNSPFVNFADEPYSSWREEKLSSYPECIEELVVKISNPAKLSSDEINALMNINRKTNAVIYQLPLKKTTDKKNIKHMGEQLGLLNLDKNLCADEDSISVLTVKNDEKASKYIPYSNKKLCWHTDGYYNKVENHIKAFLLHCVKPAVDGGENFLLDHELIYIHLRDKDPKFIKALMHPEAMTIPANIEGGKQIRPEQAGPVFFIDAQTRSLHMRFTARQKNICWRDDPATKEAVSCLMEYLESNSKYIFSYKLKAGEGLITNNVLHGRSGFADDKMQRRVFLRARYYNRIGQINSKK
jgi:hypothetical protein